MAAILFQPFGGEPRVVVKEGDPLESTPGDVRTITGLALVDTFWGQSYLSDRREIAFRAITRAADASCCENAVVMAQIADAVPAAGGLGRLALVGALLAGGLGLNVALRRLCSWFRRRWPRRGPGGCGRRFLARGSAPELVGLRVVDEHRSEPTSRLSGELVDRG